MRTPRISTSKALAFASLASFAPLAQAGTSIVCKILPFLCPPAPGGHGHGAHGVPEPATLAVLAVGACAAGLAYRRQRNKK